LTGTAGEDIVILVSITLSYTAIGRAVLRGALLAIPLLTGCGQGSLVVEGPRQVAMQGTLESGRIDDESCVWLRDARGLRVDVSYPDGWRVEFDPLRLRDRSGAVVAERGDVIAVRGPDGIGESICGDAYFVADAVEVVSVRRSP
jgi:hypothetical protein